MYCILVAGMPAAGKSTMAESIAEKWNLPVISKDKIKELLFDHVGFRSREEKVKLGIASMDIMYYAARQLMKTGQPFILENNFESSEQGIKTLLTQYQYSALTITLTGNYKVIYQRFLERDASPDRHRGFDTFSVDGEQIKIDTTDFSKIDMEKLFLQIAKWIEKKEAVI